MNIINKHEQIILCILKNKRVDEFTAIIDLESWLKNVELSLLCIWFWTY